MPKLVSQRLTRKMKRAASQWKHQRVPELASPLSSLPRDVTRNALLPFLETANIAALRASEQGTKGLVPLRPGCEWLTKRGSGCWGTQGLAVDGKCKDWCVGQLERGIVELWQASAGNERRALGLVLPNGTDLARFVWPGMSIVSPEAGAAYLAKDNPTMAFEWEKSLRRVLRGAGWHAISTGTMLGHPLSPEVLPSVLGLLLPITNAMWFDQPRPGRGVLATMFEPQAEVTTPPGFRWTRN